MGRNCLRKLCCCLCFDKAAPYQYDIVYKRQDDGGGGSTASSHLVGDNDSRPDYCSTDGDDDLRQSSITDCSPGSLTRDLRQYLNTRFLKGSADHDLQNTIRDNLYLRTVPCTTRPKREGEVDGVDYTFLPLDEFLALERSGNLLESGIYEGNHYGTPKPPRESPLQCPLVRSVANGTPSYPQIHPLLPGAHPSSEGKRRRNRSNVEAMASKSVDPDTPQLSRTQSSSISNLTPINNNANMNNAKDLNSQISGTPPELGPLSANWEKAYTENGEPYFIDHITGTSQWLDPRLARVQKKSIEDCDDDELPYGWEKIDDPHFGTYYIDHINRKTQYENPVLQAKRAKESEVQQLKPVHLNNGNVISNTPFDGESASKKDLSNSTQNDKLHTNESGVSNYPLKSHMQSEIPNVAQFTRNPAELQGSFITSTLVKGSRGFGFTIVGGDDEVEEFLQIKSVVPDGPAWQEGKLAQGDILVYVNDLCVLGYTHRDVVTIFQHIPVGEEVTLEVCRGYPLAFDLNDPNTEIVTTVAVTVNDNISNSDAHRPPPPPPMPSGVYAGNGVDKRDIEDDTTFINRGNNGLHPSERQGTPDILDFYSRVHDGSNSVPEVLTVGIVKGLMGFGFTIADSAHGQKVKKILDRPRCKNLAEGDVLLEINGRDVRGLEHAHVVQFLKDCPQGLEATITVQRGGLSSPNKSKSKLLKQAKSLDESMVPRKNESGQQPEQRFFNPTSSTKNYDSGVPTLGPYRSKTPTADIYSAHREKEFVPNRPKTPLVDTRGRPKTPTTVTVNGSFRPKTPSTGIPTDRPELLGITSMVESGTDQLGVGETLSPGSLYGRDESYSTVNENWQLGRGGRNYGDDGPTSPERGPTAHPSKFGVAAGSSNFNEWPVDMKQQEESYYGYHQVRGDGEGNASFPPSNKQFPEKEQHFPVSQSADDASNFNTYGSNSTYGINVGRGSNSNHYESSAPNNFFPYNGVYSSGGGNGTGGAVHVYETDFGGHGPAANLRKQGTSFEREQPSPVTQINRTNSSWYGPQPDRNRSFSPTFSGVNHVPEFVETTVTLYKQETGFGFRIVGGTEEGSQVSIGHIVPGGAADLDGRLRSGDEITSVDNQSVLHTSHRHVVQLMSLAGNSGRVTLGIRRRVQGRGMDNSRGKTLDGIYPYDVTVVRRENEGFGFVIISSVTRAGSTIGRIIENSPAERCGRLHVGDRILAVNGKDIMNLHHGEIVNFIKDSGLSVTLTIGPPQDDASSTTSASQKEEGIEDEQYYAVELLRGTRGFGFSIRGGREFQNMPLFVLRIADDGPAARDGRLRIGDQIVEINGINTKDMTHAEAIELIKQGGASVRLLIKRGTSKVPPPYGSHSSMPLDAKGQSLNQSHVTSPILAGSLPIAGGPVGHHHGHVSSVSHLTPALHNGPLGQSSPRVLLPMDRDPYYSQWEYERGPV